MKLYFHYCFLYCCCLFFFYIRTETFFSSLFIYRFHDYNHCHHDFIALVFFCFISFLSFIFPSSFTSNCHHHDHRYFLFLLFPSLSCTCRNTPSSFHTTYHHHFRNLLSCVALFSFICISFFNLCSFPFYLLTTTTITT